MKGYDIDFTVSYKINMKSERWQSSKSILLSHQDFRDKLKTERQWAKYYSYDWNSTTAHNSLADCLATLYCHKCMINKNSIV